MNLNVPPHGFPIGDMCGYGRVREDASLAHLALDRASGQLVSSRPGQPLLALHVDGDVRWVCAYVPGTNVLETTGRVGEAELRIVDFMPVAEGRAGQMESVPGGSFIRIVSCTEGEAAFRVACTAPQGVHVACSLPTERGEGEAVATVRLAAGESMAIVLAREPIQGGPALVAHALHALGDTIHYWTWWSDRCRYKGDDFETVLRDALTLKLGCTPGGGLLVEDARAGGFAAAPFGDCVRAAARFLELGYRHECLELLSHVVQQARGAMAGQWTCGPLVEETLARYIGRYGTTGLPEVLRAIAPAQAAMDTPAASASK